MNDSKTICSKCKVSILHATAIRNDGVCEPCSRRKGVFERDKYDGLWRLQEDSPSLPYALGGTKEGWNPRAHKLALFVTEKGSKYVDWGIRFLSEYLNISRLQLEEAEVWEARFLEDDESFEMIYELPGDLTGLWSVVFCTLPSQASDEMYWPIRLSRQER